MDFKLTINMDNAAFEDRSELTRILRGIARRPEEGQQDGQVRDINGNTVGYWEIA